MRSASGRPETRAVTLCSPGGRISGIALVSSGAPSSKRVVPSSAGDTVTVTRAIRSSVASSSLCAADSRVAATTPLPSARNRR
ncbi:MAG: hypothetical protein E6J91_29370 [Deltaproteobacteria bacterium]|nr:MAG: hypothetical protein E6J91_29370 [Deltaproteobacteria bacterium]